MSVLDLLHQNALADNDLLRKKDGMGDDFSIPRDVDFAFKTPEKQRAEDLCEFINGKNYGTDRAKRRMISTGCSFWCFAQAEL